MIPAGACVTLDESVEVDSLTVAGQFRWDISQDGLELRTIHEELLRLCRGFSAPLGRLQSTVPAGSLLPEVKCESSGNGRVVDLREALCCTWSKLEDTGYTLCQSSSRLPETRGTLKKILGVLQL